MNAFVLTAAMLAAAPAAPADEAAAVARIESFVADEMRRSRIPGLALGGVTDGRILLATGYGLAAVEHGVPVRRDTVFQSGSVAKQFAATAVMLLAEDGRLSLDDPITRFFPDAPAAWRAITVRHLLSHASGMQDYPDDYDLRRDYTEDEQVAMVRKTPLASAPGARWAYSNLGYVTVGALIRKASGRFYGDYLADRIFRPLGMRTARVISEADIVPNRASGYELEGGELKNQRWVSPSVNTTADGSLYLTLDDMLLWNAALDAGRILPPAALEQMWTPYRLSDGRTSPYGMGWFAMSAHGRRLVFHGGAWQGFKAFIARIPDERLAVIFLANQQAANDWRIARGVASVFVPELALPVEMPIEDDDPATARLARKVLRQLDAGVPDPALFTPEAVLSADRVRVLRERLASLSLPPALIASIDLLARSEAGGERTYRYALTDIAATEVFTLRLAPDGRIAGLDLTPLRTGPRP